MKIAQFRKITRQEKKDRARKDKEATAAANRVRFGRSGQEKKLARLLNEKDAKSHEALRLDRPSGADRAKTRDTDDTPEES